MSTYNGWSNYETWAVKLWLDNDQGTQETVTEMAQRARKHASNADQATYRLAANIKGLVEENAPDMGASMYADLLGAALSSVDWREIAESRLNDLEDEDN